MSRIHAVGTVLVLAASLAGGCGKKDDPEPGGGGGGGAGSGGDPRPILGTRTAEDKKEAAHRLRQIGLAMHNFESSNGHFPAGVVGPKGQLGLSWRVAILPHLEEGALFKEFKLAEPWDSEHNKRLVSRMPRVFEVPGTLHSGGKTFLRSFSGPNAFIPARPVGPKGPLYNPWANQPAGSAARGRAITGVTDGTSNSLMVVEAADPVEWTRPDDLPFSDDPAGAPGGRPRTPLPKLGGLFDGGFHGLLCDGSVRFVKDTTDEKVLRALFTVNGGEVTGGY